MADTPVPLAATAYRYENALKWIATVAGLHYFGAAFDPEHMRNIANLAADALSGERDLPDHDESVRASRARARELAEIFRANLTEEGAPDAAQDPESGRSS